MKLHAASVITIAHPAAAIAGQVMPKAEPSVKNNPLRKPHCGRLTQWMGPSLSRERVAAIKPGFGNKPLAKVSPTSLEKVRALSAHSRRPAEACCLLCPSVAKHSNRQWNKEPSGARQARQQAFLARPFWKSLSWDQCVFATSPVSDAFSWWLSPPALPKTASCKGFQAIRAVHPPGSAPLCSAF